MASFKALCLAGVASLAVTASATTFAEAADLLLPPPPPVYIPPQPVAFSGFYLRGDVGEGNLRLSNANSNFSPDYPYEDNGAPTANGKPAGFNTQDFSASSQVIVGLGVGYQFNHFFRADVTGEFRFGSQYRALEGYNFQYFPGAVDSGYSGADRYTGNISNGLILVNGYVDLGTWYHLTPYVGAGVGAAINRMSGVTDHNEIGFGQPAGASAANTKTNFAYAFMAGVAYDIAPNLKLDFGYRYVDMGRLQSGQINCYGGTSVCGDNSREVQTYHLTAQDVRIGLRYAFTDLIPVQPPLIRKY